MRELAASASDEFTGKDFENPEKSTGRPRQVPSKMPSSMQDYGVFGRLKPGNTESGSDVLQGNRDDTPPAEPNGGLSSTSPGLLGGPHHHQVRLVGGPPSGAGEESAYNLKEDEINTSVSPSFAAPGSAADKTARTPPAEPKSKEHWRQQGGESYSDLESEGEEEFNPGRASHLPHDVNPSSGVSFLHKGSAFSYTGERIRRPGESGAPSTPPLIAAPRFDNVE